ncbi:MAG: helix-turn-helix domain-containing protein [Nitritalea sp.]
MEKIRIKHMVCPRCILAVEHAFAQLQLPAEKVVLGEVLLQRPLRAEEEAQLESALHRLGFERLKDKEAIKIERIKAFLRTIVWQEEIPPSFHLSESISSHMGEDYSALSQLFSSLEGLTLEKYFIGLKIERVKELLFYEERTLSEIAYLLDYSSVQHLSAQFKKTTGMTPTAYKKGLLPGGKGWREA